MNPTRRSFIQVLGYGALTLPLVNLIASGQAQAADTPKVSLNDPTAKALNYTHQSTDAAKQCAGCQFYSGDAGAEWGPCALFPGKVVNAKGFCTSWFAKA